MRHLMADDLKDVFFDPTEFADEIKHNYINDQNEVVSEIINVVFTEKTEIILDRSSEYGDSTAYVPSILIQNTDMINIQSSKSSFEISEKQYGISYISKEDVYVTRIYLEDR